MIEILSVTSCDKLKKRILNSIIDDKFTFSRCHHFKRHHKHFTVFLLNNDNIVLIDKRNHKNVHVYAGAEIV